MGAPEPLMALTSRDSAVPLTNYSGTNGPLVNDRRHSFSWFSRENESLLMHDAAESGDMPPNLSISVSKSSRVSMQNDATVSAPNEEWWMRSWISKTTPNLQV